jgi:indolepyruvate ferredoxin oxidoreductase
MTGGQPMDGPLDVPMITRQVAAEGVGRIAVVTDEPAKYGKGTAFAPGVTVSHRDDLDKVQRELRAYRGPSVLVYDQTCAAEKRRRRKRGLYPDPPKRAFINELVCEGCGDCGVQSNCVSIVPKETPYGRKRAIDQSSCNKDFSCLNGFCPSFVTVNGGRVHRPAGGAANVDFPALPDPVLPSVDRPYGIVVAGIGGTGVVTIGALLGMAAHLEGKGVSVLDQIGLAQKNGAVVTHVRIAERSDDIHAVRISAGGARVLLGCDIVASGSPEILGTLRPVSTRAVVNAHATMTADFTHDPDLKFPGRELRAALERACGEDNADFVDAGTLATELLGDSIAVNLFTVGYAYQKGLLPVSAQAIERAIEINATAVDFNKQAFLWGRRTADDRTAVERVAGIDAAATDRRAETLDEIVARRIEELTAYRNAAYAARYAAFVDKVRQTEAERVPGQTALAEAVARSYFKLLATKDEYEVARLYTDGRFERALRHQFDGDFTLTFHLAPPILGHRDPLTGALRKRQFGPWVMRVFRILARLKALRGTPFDIFAHTPERKMERRLIADYEATVEGLLADLDRENHTIACEIAALPEAIRGFGHVKEQNLEKAKALEADLLAAYRRPAPKATAAE